MIPIMNSIKSKTPNKFIPYFSFEFVSADVQVSKSSRHFYVLLQGRTQSSGTCLAESSVADVQTHKSTRSGTKEISKGHQTLILHQIIGNIQLGKSWKRKWDENSSNWRRRSVPIFLLAERAAQRVVTASARAPIEESFKVSMAEFDFKTSANTAICSFWKGISHTTNEVKWELYLRAVSKLCKISRDHWRGKKKTYARMSLAWRGCSISLRSKVLMFLVE